MKLLLVLLTLPQLVFAKGITRTALLKGCPIPEKRDFPLDSSVSPCEDFHKYVCNKVESSFKLPDNRSRWYFSLDDSAERILYARKQFFRLLKEGATPHTAHAAQLKPYFLACMNESARKDEETAFVEKQKSEILAAQTRRQFEDLAASRMGTSLFSWVDFDTGANQKDPNKVDAVISADLLSFPEKSAYTNPENIKDLEELAQKLFEEAKVDRAQERAKWVAEFESGFAKVYPSPAEFRKLYTADTYASRAHFLKSYPSLHLNKLLEKFKKTTPLRDLSPASMKYMETTLKDASLDQLQSLLLFHTLKDVMDDAYPNYFKVFYAFQQKHFGAPSVRPDREERCTKGIMSKFGMELDAELLPILFPDFPEERVVALAEKVRASLIDGLEHNTWLSSSGRKEAIHKMRSAALRLVKPSREEDWNFLPIAEYGEKTPLANAFKADQAFIDRALNDLKKPRNRTRWHMSPLTVNAYYSGSDNNFNLMQGILQAPVFSKDQSDIENLGAIGTVVGHELGHGIDDQGSKFDAEGKKRQWMSKKDLETFAAHGKAFVDAFNKLGHNGELTLGENIGDYVGLTSSHHAAFPDESKIKESDEKKFYIAYARVWCSVLKPEFEKMLLKTNPHAMGWARINGQVVEQDGFQRAFACKPGDKMFIPKEKRVRVW